MSKPTKPSFEQVDKPEPKVKPVVEHKEESLRVPNKDEATAALYKAEMDKFFNLLEAKQSGNEASVQIGFIGTLGDLLSKDYPVYAEVMDYFISKVISNPRAFAMNNVFRYLPLREVQKEVTQEKLDRFMGYVTATITLAKNIHQRERISMMVDIPSLCADLHPKVVKNIQTYFNRTYN